MGNQLKLKKKKSKFEFECPSLCAVVGGRRLLRSAPLQAEEGLVGLIGCHHAAVVGAPPLAL